MFARIYHNAIDNIADQVQVVRIGVLQEFEQVPGLATCRARMNIGNPDSPKVHFSRCVSFSAVYIRYRV